MSRWMRGAMRCRAALLLAAASLVMAHASYAQPAAIAASETALESTVERMISYRHQQHMWKTSDGAIHVLINRGKMTASTSLRLHSSFDGGASWLQMRALAGTGIYSSSDGHLANDELSVAYSSATGEILFSVLRYDTVAKTWTLVNTETVFTPDTRHGLNPAITIDNWGTVWCAYVTKDGTTADASIRMARRASELDGWVDTGFVFGDVDNLSIERSARPVRLSDRVGMIYTVHENIYWAYRTDSMAPTEPWITKLLFTSPDASDVDPYASHFSLAADSQNNLHMATVDRGRLLYFRYADKSASWAPGRALTNDIGAGYVQVVLPSGNVAIVANSGTHARVYQSTDKGTTFALKQLLTHAAPTPDGEISYDLPRIEAPGFMPYASSIPVLQQYKAGTSHRLMFFDVPVVTAQ